jgi:hypothetical protein
LVVIVSSWKVKDRGLLLKSDWFCDVNEGAQKLKVEDRVTKGKMESDLEADLQGGKETGSVERGKVWALAPVAVWLVPNEGATMDGSAVALFVWRWY